MSETKASWPALSLALLASCAGARSESPKPMSAADCDVTIVFGSFATGIDRKAAAAVDQLLDADKSVTRVERSRTGIEGEYSLCVRTASRGDAVHLFERLRQGLREPVRAPVSVTGPGGSYSAPTLNR